MRLGLLSGYGEVGEAVLDLGCWRNRLHSLPPGPELVAALADRPDTLAPAPVNDPEHALAVAARAGAAGVGDRVVTGWANAVLESIIARARVLSWLQAEQYTDLALLSQNYPGLHELLPTEIAFALRTNESTAGNAISTARSLSQRLPRTLEALRAGVIDADHALSLARATGTTTAEVATSVEADLLPLVTAPGSTITAEQLRRRAVRRVIARDPDGAAERHQRAAGDRKITRWVEDDGMAGLKVLAPAQQVAAIWEAATALADAAKYPGDSRTLGARRVDALTDVCSDILSERSTPPAPPRPVTPPTNTEASSFGSERQPDHEDACAKGDYAVGAERPEDDDANAETPDADTTTKNHPDNDNDNDNDTTGHRDNDNDNDANAEPPDADTTTKNHPDNGIDIDITATGHRDKDNGANQEHPDADTDCHSHDGPATNRRGGDAREGNTDGTGFERSTQMETSSHESTPGADRVDLIESSGTPVAAGAGGSPSVDRQGPTSSNVGAVEVSADSPRAGFGGRGSGPPQPSAAGGEDSRPIDPDVFNRIPGNAGTAGAGVGVQPPGTAIPVIPSASPINDSRPRLPAKHGTRPQIMVLVPYTVLLGGNDPCEIVGHGAITADQALPLIADGTLQRLLYEPVTGMLLDYGRTRYEPPESLRRFVITRDRRCRTPGCDQPAHRCQIDHVEPFRPGQASGGSTSDDNLDAKCLHHHRAKDGGGFTNTRDGNGTTRWTTPLNRVYTLPPPQIVEPHGNVGAAGSVEIDDVENDAACDSDDRFPTDLRTSFTIRSRTIPPQLGDRSRSPRVGPADLGREADAAGNQQPCSEISAGGERDDIQTRDARRPVDKHGDVHGATRQTCDDRPSDDETPSGRAGEEPPPF